MGLKRTSISHFETGTRKPSFNNLRKLAELLEITSDYLIGKSENPERVANVNVTFLGELKNLSSDQRKMTLNFIKMLKNK